ncbi:LLM class flavin-dependent oxidoreductase [Nocardioides sp.]|jgi:alkanesulfonate monooxygenase SsuD/methylene tetrahydromethanopterin reductase-like flavin-dependent oxidoreductase (luciferase family)|uniref:LLM class flavin-dependent oxidoreductase n=1 Tax=Nocardioides sp. TaxID=35761 RepID=UPI00321A8F7B
MGRPVTFGLINTFGNPEEWREPWPQRYAGILEQIEWIDRETSIDGVYVTEHHFYDDGYMPSTMVMCGAIAARTSRVRIGTNLIQLPLHNAVRLAEDALVVDALSGGRLRLGLGMGYYHQEFDGMGQRLAERVSRTEEGIAILRKAFAGEPFEFHGKRYDFDTIRVTPGPVREGGPEIWLGAFAPKAIERAARLADGFLEFDLGTHRAYFDACEALGKPQGEQRLNVTYWAIIAEDPEKAFAEAGDHWLHLLNQYIQRDAYAARTPPLTEPYTDARKALADGLVMLADGPTAVKTFNADVDKGAIDINLVTMMPGEPVDQVTERLQYLNDHVIPHVKHTTHPAGEQ